MCSSDLSNVYSQINSAADNAVLHKVVEYSFCFVRWYGKAYPFHFLVARFGIDNAYKIAAHIKQSAARVAGIDRRVRLQKFHSVIADGDRPLCRGQYAFCDRAAERSERIPYRYQVLADLQAVAVAPNSDVERARFLNGHDRYVVALVRRDKCRGVNLARM